MREVAIYAMPPKIERTTWPKNWYWKFKKLSMKNTNFQSHTEQRTKNTIFSRRQNTFYEQWNIYLLFLRGSNEIFGKDFRATSYKWHSWMINFANAPMWKEMNIIWMDALMMKWWFSYKLALDQVLEPTTSKYIGQVSASQILELQHKQVMTKKKLSPS